jgi:hypothetical protein
MLRSVRDKVQEIVQEMRQTLSLSEITFAVREETYCFYATSFVSEPDYVQVTGAFTAFQPSPLAVLENFASAQLITQYIGLEAHQGSGSGHYYRYTEYGYSTTVARRASPTLTLSLQSLTIRFEYTGAYATYIGQAVIDNAGTQLPFSVVVPYNRPANSDYIVHLAVRSQYRLGEFVDLVAPAAGCSGDLTLPAISDMRQLPVLMVDLPFTQVQAIMSFSDLVVFFYMPPFALAPSIYLDSPTASLRIRTALPSCSVAIDSTWRRDDVPTLNLHIDQNLRNTIVARAYVAAEPRMMTISDIAQNFYTEMYPDPFNMFPVYNRSVANIGDTLGRIEVLQPVLTLTFTPEVVIRVTGAASYLLDEDTRVDIAMGRVNGALESFVQVDVSSAEMITRLVGADTTPLVGFTLLLNRIVSSSVSLDLAQTSPLRGESVPARRTNAGFEAFLNLEMDDQCTRSEYCTILQNSQGQNTLSLSGRFVPDYFLLSSTVANITLSNTVTFYNSILRMYFGPPRVDTWVEGLFDIQGDSATLVSFRTNLTNINSDARLAGTLRGQWRGALDLQQLTLQGLQLLGDVDRSGRIVDSTIRGVGSFGPCTEADCWFGDAVLSMSIVEYRENFVVMTMRPTTSNIFFTRLMLLNSLSPLLTRLAFPTDMTVSYSYREHARVPAGLMVSSQVTFMGLQGQLTCNGQFNSQNVLQVFLQMPFFVLGAGNLQVAGSYNAPVSGRLDYSADTVQTTGIIVGTVSIWGMSQVTNIRLTDTQLEVDIPGYPFGGVYYFDLTISGAVSADITNSTLTATAQVDSNSTSILESQVRDSLIRWAQQAADTLQRIRDLLARQQALIDAYSSELCTEPCPTIQECVSEPQYVCTQNAVLESCSGSKQGCTQVLTSCDSSASTCMQSQATCAVYDTQTMGGNCVQWDTTCVNAIETCQGWRQECVETVEEGCAVIEHEVVNTTCLHQELLCDQRTIVDSTCTVRCQNLQNMRDAAQTTYDLYQAAYNDSISAFGALTELLEANVVVFTVIFTQLDSMSFITPLITPGLGPNDIEMKVVFLIPNLSTQKQTAYSVQTKWSFFTEVENQVRLSSLARQQIVQVSNGRLSAQMEEESPVEVFERLLRARTA